MDFSSFVDSITTLLWQAEIVAIAVAMVVFLYGIVRFITHAENTTEHAKGYKLMFWGIIALVAAIFIPGIASMISDSIFKTNNYVSAPQSGTSVAPYRATSPFQTTSGSVGPVDYAAQSTASSWWTSLGKSTGLW